MSKRRTVNIFKRDMVYDQRYLTDEALRVLSSIPNPFGSFEKAKYELYSFRANRSKKPIYFFTTTSHNTEDCIEILRTMFYERAFWDKNFTIYKILNGITEIIYKEKPLKHTKEVDE